jgi:biopolymer transport protein ExbD
VSFNRADSGEDGDDDDIVAEINVTPLTDIFLVLLIIFMVTSSAMLQQGTPVSLPRAGSGGSEPSGVLVTATADKRVEVNGQQVGLEELRQALVEAMAKTGDSTVILQGDRSVVLERAVQIMSIAKEAGATRISIATAPPDPGGGA